ncbi:MAG: hypothetical protein OXF60_04325 [Gammaproteobacteria bacterium]|nr:hypothetical protein [Gammaproteobacteria bacterium]MCY4219874.1 hypothetical protein [Gammaproteobacteria bacterium]
MSRTNKQQAKDRMDGTIYQKLNYRPEKINPRFVYAILGITNWPFPDG